MERSLFKMLCKLVIVELLCIESIEESCSFPILWKEVYSSVELFYYHFAYDQAKADAVGIDAFGGVFNGAKHFEHFALVFLLDA